MHLEILVEDQSGKKALEILLPKIIAGAHTWDINWYKGIGRLPQGLNTIADPSKRILLEQLPKLLRGYGKTFAGYGQNYKAAVVVIMDLDNKNLANFIAELNTLLSTCIPRPETRFCIAIEEGEAWILGDIAAIKAAYPNALDSVLSSYENDSICGTWEKLADAIYPGGSQALKALPWYTIGKTKYEWSESISPHMVVESNFSPSFCFFKEKILELISN